MIYILGCSLVFMIFCYAILTVTPKTDEEQRMEDEEQMKYIEWYKKEYRKM